MFENVFKNQKYNNDIWLYNFKNRYRYCIDKVLFFDFLFFYFLVFYYLKITCKQVINRQVVTRGRNKVENNK